MQINGITEDRCARRHGRGRSASEGQHAVAAGLDPPAGRREAQARRADNKGRRSVLVGEPHTRPASATADAHFLTQRGVGEGRDRSD